jgi:hypothetical protein
MHPGLVSVGASAKLAPPRALSMTLLGNDIIKSPDCAENGVTMTGLDDFTPRSDRQPEL